MADFILEAREVGHDYPDGTRALDGVTLALERGVKAAFLGPNGAGKTTLFLHFNGILKPTRGKVLFSGREVRYDHRSLMDLRSNVGIVFQDPDTQLFSASVMQEVSFGPMNLGLPRDEVVKRVSRAMEDTGIAGLGDRPTHFLSEGQKKRVSIADILAMEPPVIIFDEPTASLDPGHRRMVLDLLERISRGGATVILSTHDVDLAYSWADRIFVMKDGRLEGEGPPGQVLRNGDLISRAGLEKPWLVEVYDALRSRGWLLDGEEAPRTMDGLLEILPRNGCPGQDSPGEAGLRPKKQERAKGF